MFELDNVDRALRDLEAQIGAPSVQHMPQNTNQGFIYAIRQLADALKTVKKDVDKLKTMSAIF